MRGQCQNLAGEPGLVPFDLFNDCLQLRQKRQAGGQTEESRWIFYCKPVLARHLLRFFQMSSLDNIYQKMVPNLEPSTLAQLHHEPPPEQSRHIGRDVAHELNNILTVIQGYADRLIMKQGENSALRAELQTISDSAKRAVTVIRQSRKAAAPASQTA